MVLCKRYLPPSGELVPAGKPTGTNSAVYHQVTQNRSTGLLTQLALLTQFASEVFTSVIQDVQTTQTRIDNLKTRSANLQQRMSTNSKYYSNPANLMNPRVDISLGQEITDQVLARQTLPKPLAIAYSKCQAPPGLDGPALKLYTNPDFFVESFLKDQHSRIVNQRREHQRSVSARKSNKDVVKRGLQKVTYDETGKMIVSNAESRPTPPPKISVPTPSKPAPIRMVDTVVTAPPEFASPLPSPAIPPPRTHQQPPPLPPSADPDSPPPALPPSLPRELPPDSLPPSLPPSFPSDGPPPALPPSMPPRHEIPPPISEPPPALPPGGPPPVSHPQQPPSLPPSVPPTNLPPTGPPAMPPSNVPPAMPPPMQPTPQPASPPGPPGEGMKRGGGPPPPPPGAMKQGGGVPPPPGQKPAMNIPDVNKKPPAPKPQMAIPESSGDRDGLLAQIREGRNKPLNKVVAPDPAQQKPKPANQNTQQSQLEAALEAMRRDIGDSQSEDDESWSQDWGED